MTKLKTIRDVVLPMRALNWLLGCESMEYPLGNPHETIGFLYALAWIVFYSLISYADYSFQPEVADRVDIAELIIRSSFTYFQIFFVVPVTFFMAWKRGKELTNIFKEIEKVDKLLWRLNIRNEYAKMYKKQSFLAVFAVTMITILLIVNWNCFYFPCMMDCTLFQTFVISTRVVYPRLLLFINDFSFISYTICLEQKFTQLNDALQAMSRTSYFCPQYIKVFNFAMNVNEGESFQHGRKTNDDVEMIKIAKKAHLDLVEICKQINKIFRLQLLASLIDAGTWIIYVAYVYYLFYFINGIVSLTFIIQIMTWFISYVITLIGVNHICEKTTNEAMRTGRVICELHEPATKEEFRSEIRDFTLQLIQSPLKFTSLSFITFNHSLIQDILGGITTYLVILIQLRDIDEDEDE